MAAPAETKPPFFIFPIVMGVWYAYGVWAGRVDLEGVHEAMRVAKYTFIFLAVPAMTAFCFEHARNHAVRRAVGATKDWVLVSRREKRD